MRKLVVASLSALALVAAIAPTATGTSKTSRAARLSRLSLNAKITGFQATASGVIANGTLTGKLTSGSSVSRDTAPARFSVVGSANSARCNVLTLRLAPVYLELLGVEVKTSYISLDVYAVRGRVLGNLFCALANAKVSFPKAARDLNAHLSGHPLQVLSTSDTLPARTAQAAPASCQVLKLVLGPLHLDLLGLVVDLYGRTKASPVKVIINAVPSQGLLGQLLCGLAGGTGITDVSGLQTLLSTLGVNLSTAQIQHLLNQVGITDLSGGLTQLQLNEILRALGFGSTTPSG